MMKKRKPILLLFCLFLFIVGNAQVSKTINVSTSGTLSTLLTTTELNTVTDLIITGTMDARDFKTIRDKMPMLTHIDLSGATILSYTGTDGSYQGSGTVIYPANCIPKNAFSGKIKLNSIIIPSTVTSISSYAFSNCIGLISFVIPSTVNSIEELVFYGCTGLTSIYSNMSYPVDLNNSYGVFYNIGLSSCKLYVPYKSKALYAAAYQWNTFTTIIESTQGFITGSDKTKLAYTNGSSGEINILANVNWTAASDQSWLTVNPLSGSGDSKLNFTVAGNDSTSRRYAKVTVSSPGLSSQTVTIAQIGFPKKINISAGGLSTALTPVELSTIDELIITGRMDPRDFKTIRDQMPELTKLDLSDVTIDAYSGAGGTYNFSTGYSANSIPPDAFYDYDRDRAKAGLISIKIPPSVTSIGYAAFQSCTGLTSIYINSTSPVDLTNSGDPFYKTNKTGCTLYVPYGTKQYYATAPGWKDFTNIVENNKGFLVSQRSIRFAASTNSKTSSIPVKANVVWKAQSDKPWLVLTSNDSILTLTAEANASDTIRKATINVSSTGFYSQLIEVTQAAAPRKVTAGGLSVIVKPTELNTLTEIALMGTIDARDFKTMRDNMITLSNIDLSSVNIVAYEGTDCDPWGGTSIKKYPANEIPYKSFYMSKKIKSITLPESVTAIGEYAFGLTSLSAVTFSKSLRYIGVRAFDNSTDLSSITLPDSVVIIGEYAFNGCTKLSGNLLIPSSVKTIRNSAFNGCSNLSGDLIIPSTIDSVGNYAFNTCNNLSSLVIESSNTSIGDYAFSGCWKLNSITFPSTLTTIGKNVFSGCYKLESVNFPSTLKSIGEGAFSSTGLSTINFPASLTAIGASSFSLSRLTSLNIPATLINIGESAFANCFSLNAVSFPSTQKKLSNGLFSGCTSLDHVELSPSLEAIGDNAFNGCTALATINFPASLKYIGRSAFSNCSGFNEVILPSKVKYIGSFAFSSCTGLRSIQLPDSIRIIEPYTFSRCKSLEAINIPTSVDSIRGRAFEFCDVLNKVNLPPTLSAIENGVFYYCSGLTSLTIPSTVKTIDEEAFYYCTSLTKMDFPPNLTTIGENAFEYCDGLTSLVFPESVTSIKYRAFEFCSSIKTVQLSQNLQNLGDEVFSGCAGITSIDLPQKLKTLGSGCFMNCSALRSIVIPPLITYIGSSTFSNCKSMTSVSLNSNIVSLDAYAFYGCGFKTIELPNTLKTINYEALSYCKNLTSITIPSNVTTIGGNAFQNCPELTSINIPASVTSIGQGAFNLCSKLSNIYAYTTTPVDLSSSGDAFWGVDKTSCNLYVPIGRKSVYLNALYWKDFTHIIELTTAVPILKNEKINIFLNPVSQSLKFNGLEGTNKISIYDLNGKTMLYKQVQSDENISISNFPTGMYVVRITTKEGTIEQKVLKK